MDRSMSCRLILDIMSSTHFYFDAISNEHPRRSLMDIRYLVALVIVLLGYQESICNGRYFTITVKLCRSARWTTDTERLSNIKTEFCI